VQFVPDLGNLPIQDIRTSNLDGLLALELQVGLHSFWNRFFKRCIDLACGAAAGLLLLPALLILYLAVRLDSRGPAFYAGERIGKDGKSFKCLKFRTMYLNAEERLKEMMALDPVVRYEYEIYHKLEDDPRITRVGKFLRRFSLDELPQIWNVLKAEMSLVGPRPYLTRERSDMQEAAEVILTTYPGITGYWQVSGRNNLTFQERLDMESHYVHNWSIWWDIIILVQTFKAVFKRDGAK
jgi:undecaprenyl-phosphate galactose phosphotransferase